MNLLWGFNISVGILFTLCYFYQFIYIPVAWFKKRKAPEKEAPVHRIAALICARNESAVIADLIDSLKAQDYPQDMLTVFVLADNCQDDTAAVSEKHGAVVYTRTNTKLVGKGYALEALLAHIKADYPGVFDGFLVFDADNILAPDYVTQMNRTFSRGNDIITSYRNSKNYGDNWISAGYALWFLRESRYLNNSRDLVRSSCAVSGTGFFFSRKVAEEIGGWPFHTLTEDIEFSSDRISHGERIAFCPDAVLYDEQPVSFAQSWRQRLRWSRGFLQVVRRYGWALIKGIFRGSFPCYDMAMTIMPAFFLSALTVVSNIVICAVSASRGEDMTPALRSIGWLFFETYFLMFILGAITTVTEWHRIYTTTAKKILYVFTFPVFMLTYIPIAMEALFVDPSWKPIQHTRRAKSLTEAPFSAPGHQQ